MSTELTPEQKLRQTITGNPFVEPDFKHEGEDVVRWLTGGTDPDAWVTEHPEGERIVVRCAGCQNIIGYLPADPFAKEEMARQIGAIREAGHENHKPDGWPYMNVANRV
jgi:hypothetical protein